MEDRNRVVQAEQQRLRKKKVALRKKKERKKNFRKSILKIFLFLFTFVLTFILYDGNFSIDTSGIHLPSFKLPKISLFSNKNKKKNNTPGEIKEKDGIVLHDEIVSNLDGKKIAFVPLDDLPLHSSWISGLFDSTNYKIVMPDAKYYRTQLGESVNSYAGYSTKYGNPIKIASWLLEMEEDGCNYYVISLDQLFSGGLIPSTYVNDDDMNVYTGDYKKVKSSLEKILNNEENHVYLIDTVMGLTVERDFMDVTANDNNLLREYSIIPRKRLSSEDLTIKNINAIYKTDQNGNSIPTELDETVLKRYLDARVRKLNLSKYITGVIANSPNKKNIKLFYSYDNNMTNNIVTNDLSYIENILDKKSVNYIFNYDNNSIDLVALMSLYTDNLKKSFVASIHYYGDETSVIDGTNYTYEDYMNDLFKELGISISDKGYIDVLVYTKCMDASKREEYTKSLIEQYISNIKKHIPTIIINGASLDEDKVLLESLEKKNILGYMIGYSNNGGFVRSSRLALFEGLTRYLYLTNSSKKDNSDKNYLKSLSYSLINDIVYVKSPLSDSNINTLNSYMSNETGEIISRLENSNYIADLINYEERGIKSINIYNYRFPWNRTNEINFVVSISVSEEKDIDLDKEL